MVHPRCPRRAARRGPARLPALLALLSLLGSLPALTACSGSGSGRGLERPRGSSLWVEGDAPPADDEAWAALESAGIEEVFIGVGDLAWEGGRPRVVLSWFEASTNRRLPVTLAIGGEWPAGEIDAETVTAALEEEVRRVQLTAQGRGLIPRGIHLDLRCPAAAVASFAAVLEELGGRLDPALLLSVTLDRALLEHPEAPRLTDAVDFFVTFLYGQREGEREDPTAWDLEALEAALPRLTELEADYLVGVSTLGWVGRAEERGAGRESTTEASLHEIVEARGLESTFGFSLEGADRLVYTFVARSPLRVAGWRLGVGDRLRVSRPSGGHVRRLVERLAELAPEGHLGQLYYRLPLPRERLSLSLPTLAAALSPPAGPPVITAAVAPGGRAGGGVVLRVQVHNPGMESTDVAHLKSNYVELVARRGSFRRVDAGGFHRYDLLDGRSGRRSLDDPDTLRLYTPLLEAGEALISGPIVLAGAAGPEDVTVGGEFLMLDGTMAPVVAAREGEQVEEPGTADGGG